MTLIGPISPANADPSSNTVGPRKGNNAPDGESFADALRERLAAIVQAASHTSVAPAAPKLPPIVDVKVADSTVDTAETPHATATADATEKADTSDASGSNSVAPSAASVRSIPTLKVVAHDVGASAMDSNDPADNAAAPSDHVVASRPELVRDANATVRSAKAAAPAGAQGSEPAEASDATTPTVGPAPTRTSSGARHLHLVRDDEDESATVTTALQRSIAAAAAAASGATAPAVPSAQSSSTGTIKQPASELPDTTRGVSAPGIATGVAAIPVAAGASLVPGTLPEAIAQFFAQNPELDPQLAKAKHDNVALKSDVAPEIGSDQNAESATPFDTAIATVVKRVVHASADAATSGATAQAHASARRTTNSADDAQASEGSAPAVADGAAQPANAPGFALVGNAAAPVIGGAVSAGDTPQSRPRTAPELKTPQGPAAHATLELDAAKTGASRIRIAVQGSQVRATITASDNGAATLDRQLPELRRSLEERGFSDIRLSVRTQEHVGSTATNTTSATDDARSSGNPQREGSGERLQQQRDTGERADSQRRRRQQEEDQQ